eukprot:352362-Chlamydomonas_euryale.AAC.3
MFEIDLLKTEEDGGVGCAVPLTATPVRPHTPRCSASTPATQCQRAACTRAWQTVSASSWPAPLPHQPRDGCSCSACASEYVAGACGAGNAVQVSM